MNMQSPYPMDLEATPGPWEARTFLVMGGDGLHDRIVHVGGNLPPTRVHESVANARLIAAAPDLYAALREAQGLAEMAVMSDDGDGTPSDDQESLVKLRAKIAAALEKARGPK